ncbi:MAG: WD40 repeat domain-containing protein [Singulisphaera sp.]
MLVLSVLDRYVDVGGATPPVAETHQVRLASGSTLKVVQVPDALRRVISADGRTLACLALHDPSRATCSLIVYDLASGRGTAVPKVTRDQWIVDVSEGGGRHRYRTSLAISPDGRRVALNDQTTHIQVVDTRDGRTLWKAGADLFGPKSLVTALSFSPDGRHVVSGDARGMVRLWDAESGHPCATAPFTPGPIAAVGFYPDGGTVAAVAHGENSIRFWPIVPKPEPPAAMNHGDEVWDLAFLPGGTHLVSAGDDYRIRLWDVGRGAQVRTIGEHETLVTALATSPDGKTLVSADYDGHVRLRDLGGIDAPVRALADFPGKVRTLAWSPDGRHLAIGGNATVIHVWERDTDRVLRVTPPHEDTFGLAWSPDGSVLAAASHQRRISLWRWPDRTLVQVLESRDPLTCLDFSRDGKALVAGDTAGGLHSFVRAGSRFLPATSRQASGVGGVWDLDFSPDGRTLATASDDGSVRLWDPSGLRDLCRLARPAGKVHALAFSPSGRQLASADFQGLITIHHAGPTGGD